MADPGWHCGLSWRRGSRALCWTISERNTASSPSLAGLCGGPAHRTAFLQEIRNNETVADLFRLSPVLPFGVQSDLQRAGAQGAGEAHPAPASLRGAEQGLSTPSTTRVGGNVQGHFGAHLGLPPMDCFQPSVPPSLVGVATSCQLARGARHKSNQRLPASLGLPRPQAVEPSPLQAPTGPTAARSGTPGLPARPPALPRQQTAPSLATDQPADPGRKPNCRYWNGKGHPGPAPLRTQPAILSGPGLCGDSHVKR